MRENFRRQENDRRGAVSHFRVLAHADINERLGGGVLNLQQPHDGRPVVADRYSAARRHELVAARWTQRRADHVGDSLTRIHVGDQLRLALCVCLYCCCKDKKSE